jgi:hypothetical protein
MGLEGFEKKVWKSHTWVNGLSLGKEKGNIIKTSLFFGGGEAGEKIPSPLGCGVCLLTSHGGMGGLRAAFHPGHGWGDG